MRLLRRRSARDFWMVLIGLVAASLFGSIHFHRSPLGLFSTLRVGGIPHAGARTGFEAPGHERKTLSHRLDQLRYGGEK